AGVVLLIVAAILGYSKWVQTREDYAMQSALDYAESEQGKAALGRDGRAAVYRLVGEYAVRKHQAGSAAASRERFEKSLSALGPATDAGGSATERDALLQDLALAEVELGG